ncbi:glycosyltransferase [Streptomyces sp. ME02-8801-2C]|uniref:glycosyltransferase n=1 Tax=Streptomyces sp. ME02-8801-2C TaxID=3028680 RepID=UPI0029BA1B1C|nr:glycosyltransferase [Streptomyces sp. ME02-8801-2C]MDX3454006.1 glycosyltransferase [Streptomyces sp. ME02-8801-2C]
MRVLLSTYGSRGDVQPMAALAVALRELGARVRVCAPSDEEFAKLLAGVGVEFVPAAEPVRAVVTGAAPMTPEALPQRAAALTAAQYEAVLAAAEGCDAVVATGLVPAVAAARSVAEQLGVPFRYVAYFPTMLPSPHHRPHALPGRPFPPDETDNRVLWNLTRESFDLLYGPGINAHRTSIGQAVVDDTLRHVFTDRPLLAADPVLGPWPTGPTKPKEPPYASDAGAGAGLAVVQTGAWILPDERPLPAEVLAFLDAGESPVYVGFGSMPMRESADVARVAVEAVRAQGRRVLVGRGWADLALIDDQDDCLAVGDVNHQSLFPRVAAVVHHGGAGTTTTVARAGAPQVIVPQIVDQPYWAARVAELGIGAAHDGPTPTFDSLSAALDIALSPGTRERAAAVAATIRTDGATVAARLLLDTVARKNAGNRPALSPHPRSELMP